MHYQLFKIFPVFLFIPLFFFHTFFKDSGLGSNIFHLFIIERSKDANQIFYDLNLTDSNQIATKSPMSIYWLRHTEKGKIVPLSWIQKNYAYGLNYLAISKTETIFQFVSYKNRNFHIKKDRKGQFNVFTAFDNKELIVKKIYIYLEGGTFWFPKIPKVELHLEDPITHENLTKTIIVNADDKSLQRKS